jgi:hypothetical protein
MPSQLMIIYKQWVFRIARNAAVARITPIRSLTWRERWLVSNVNEFSADDASGSITA